MTPGRVCIGASRLSNARLLQSTNVKRRSSGLFKSGLERSDVTWQCRSARYSPAQRLFSTSQIGWTLKVQTTGGQAMSASHQKKTIVVGVDGSDQATAALDWAIRLAGPLSAEIVAVFAVSPPSYFGYGYAIARPEVAGTGTQRYGADLVPRPSRVGSAAPDGHRGRPPRPGHRGRRVPRGRGSGRCRSAR